MAKKATAVWTGSGKEGSGHLTTETQVLNQAPYTWASRFADGKDTNPEELIAAAHAGCFTMKLTFVLGAAGFTPEKLETTCAITLDSGAITQSHLTLNALVPGISPEVFENCVRDAEQNCPVSKVLNTDIVVEYTLTA